MTAEDNILEPVWLDFLPEFLRGRVKDSRALQKIITNIGWLLFDKALRMGVGLLVGVWIARYLGPGQFGILNYSVAFVGLFGGLTTLGLDSIVVRELVRRKEDKSLILGTAFLLKLAASLLSSLLALASVHFLKDDALITLAAAIIAGTIVVQSLDVIRFWFESQVSSKYVVLSQNLAFLLVAGLKILLLTHKAPLIWFVWMILLESVLSAIGFIYYYRRSRESVGAWTFSAREAKTLLRDSWPLILSGLAIAVYMRIDQVMLGSMLGDEAVGNYSAAVKISEIWYFIPAVISVSAYPALIELKKRSESEYLARFQQLFRVMAYITVPIAVLVSFFSGHIVGLLYGTDYLGAAKILAIHIWTGIFVFWGVAGGYFYVIENLSELTFYRSLYGAVINILLNLLLIPLWGGVGAAVATLVAYSVQAYFSELFNGATRIIFKLKTKALLGIG